MSRFAWTPALPVKSPQWQPIWGEPATDYGFKADAGNFIALGGKAGLTVVSSWPSLLAAANRLLADNEYAAGVIVAQTACEVMTERAMVTKAPAHKPLFTYAPRKTENLAAYKNATGENGIDTQPFWAGYLELIENRNKASHAGHEVDCDTAQENIDAAKAFVAHVAHQNGL